MTPEQLREALDYDPDTGIFRWKIDRNHPKARKGMIAGKKTKRGYWWIAVLGHFYAAHRLAWFYTYGQWPPGQMDHANRVKTDNRLSNLRLATQSQNSANMWRDKQNTSGYKGVYWHKKAGKWSARIRKDYHEYHLGLFENIEDANAVRVAKARELFGEFA